MGDIKKIKIIVDIFNVRFGCLNNVFVVNIVDKGSILDVII